MITQNPNKKQILSVEVSRIEPKINEQTGEVFLKAQPLALTGAVISSPLAATFPEETEVVSKQKPIIPFIRIVLDDGVIEVNERPVKIPVGTKKVMTGKEFKQLLEIYRGDALFIKSEKGLQRIQDKDFVEVLPGSKFEHKAIPKPVQSTPRYGLD